MKNVKITLMRDQYLGLPSGTRVTIASGTRVIFTTLY